MNKIDSYQDLLNEEKRLSEETARSLAAFLEQGEKLFHLEKILSTIWEENKKTLTDNYKNEAANDNLVTLFLDLAYHSLTKLWVEKLFTSENPQTEQLNMNIKLGAKTILDYYFEQNKEAMSKTISEFIEKKFPKKKD